MADPVGDVRFVPVTVASTPAPRSWLDDLNEAAERNAPLAPMRAGSARYLLGFAWTIRWPGDTWLENPPAEADED